MALMATIAADVETRTCKLCHQDKPLHDFARSTGGRLRTCKSCRAAARRTADTARRSAGLPVLTSQQRERQADLRRRLGHSEVELAPDPAPARLLGELLDAGRRRGETFDDVWIEATSSVLGGIDSGREREDWRRAFDATGAAWRAGWDRQHVGLTLSPALLDGF